VNAKDDIYGNSIQILQKDGLKNMDQKSLNQKNERKIPENLPSTDDKDFWGDAEIIESSITKIEMKKNHVWHQKGNQAICTVCPLRHGLFLAPDQEVRDGKIVKKLPPKP